MQGESVLVAQLVLDGNADPPVSIADTQTLDIAGGRLETGRGGMLADCLDIQLTGGSRRYSGRW